MPKEVPDQFTVIAWHDVCQWHHEYTVQKEIWNSEEGMSVWADIVSKDHAIEKPDCKISPDSIRVKVTDPATCSST